MYYEVAEGGIPAVQGMDRTHEGVLKVALHPLLSMFSIQTSELVV